MANMDNRSILHPTLHREWFPAIAAGTNKIEHRDRTIHIGRFIRFGCWYTVPGRWSAGSYWLSCHQDRRTGGAEGSYELGAVS